MALDEAKGIKMEENDGGVPSLPEGCISSIIAFTSPKDASRAATVSRVFKSASESNTVWEAFLPDDYKDIIFESINPPVNCATKKELFFHLCHSPILINDGKLSFWLSQSSGKKCYMLCARELSIAWQDTPAYWGWTTIPESRFSEVAELRSVCWLDIKGKMPTQMLSLKTTYAAYLVYKITDNSYGLEVVAKSSVRFAEATGGSGTDTSASRHNLTDLESNSIYLKTSTRRRRLRRSVLHMQLYPIDGRVPQRRMDGWMEIFLGEFYNGEGEGDIEIKILETEILNWKRGLVLEGIELRPME